MTDATLKTTGHYRYAKKNCEEIRFISSNGLDRSFTILIVEDYIGDSEAADEHKGIAVIDNDNNRVVFDGLYAEYATSSPCVVFKVADFTSANWTLFSKMCREHKNYKGGIRDIDTATPNPDQGNIDRQLKLGLTPQDIRSDFTKSISQDPKNPYSFPCRNRIGMEADICDHFTYVAPRGPAHLGWDIRMNIKWNRTGYKKGGTPLDRQYDASWRHTIKNNASVIKDAGDRLIAPYVSGPIGILDQDTFLCDFEIVGKNSGFIILKKFCGFHMGGSKDISIADRIFRLSDTQLEALWVACYVMDEDLCVENRRSQMQTQMEIARLDFEKQTA